MALLHAPVPAELIAANTRPYPCAAGQRKFDVLAAMSTETFFVIHFTSPVSIALRCQRKIIFAENLVEHDLDVVAGVVVAVVMWQRQKDE